MKAKFKTLANKSLYIIYNYVNIFTYYVCISLFIYILPTVQDGYLNEFKE